MTGNRTGMLKLNKCSPQVPSYTAYGQRKPGYQYLKRGKSPIFFVIYPIVRRSRALWIKSFSATHDLYGYINQTLSESAISVRYFGKQSSERSCFSKYLRNIRFQNSESRQKAKRNLQGYPASDDISLQAKHRTKPKYLIQSMHCEYFTTDYFAWQNGFREATDTIIRTTSAHTVVLTADVLSAQSLAPAQSCRSDED